MTATKKEKIVRSQRFNSRPDAFNSYVRFQVGSDEVPAQAGQFGDISTSGMRLISRTPVRASVGDFVKVQFTLPGSKVPIASRARIVRKTNEFEFAVRFMNFEESAPQIAQAIREHSHFIQTSGWTLPLKSFAKWFVNHKQGLLISAIGFTIALAIGTWIHVNSDAYKGQTLKSWGKDYPKELDLEYVKKFNK